MMWDLSLGYIQEKNLFTIKKEKNCSNQRKEIIYLILGGLGRGWKYGKGKGEVI